MDFFASFLLFSHSPLGFRRWNDLLEVQLEPLGFPLSSSFSLQRLALGFRLFRLTDKLSSPLAEWRSFLAFVTSP
jgi:hypothetical protein